MFINPSKVLQLLSLLVAAPLEALASSSSGLRERSLGKRAIIWPLEGVSECQEATLTISTSVGIQSAGIFVFGSLLLEKIVDLPPNASSPSAGTVTFLVDLPAGTMIALEVFYVNGQRGRSSYVTVLPGYSRDCLSSTGLSVLSSMGTSTSALLSSPTSAAAAVPVPSNPMTTPILTSQSFTTLSSASSAPEAVPSNAIPISNTFVPSVISSSSPTLASGAAPSNPISTSSIFSQNGSAIISAPNPNVIPSSRSDNQSSASSISGSSAALVPGNSTALSDPLPTPSGHSLSGGAIAGIVVGSLALAALLLFLSIRRRRSAKNSTSNASPFNPSPSHSPHSYTTYANSNYDPNQLQSTSSGFIPHPDNFAERGNMQELAGAGGTRRSGHGEQTRMAPEIMEEDH